MTRWSRTDQFLEMESGVEPEAEGWRRISVNGNGVSWQVGAGMAKMEVESGDGHKLPTLKD